MDRRAFLKELGIRDDAELHGFAAGRQGISDRRRNQIGGADLVRRRTHGNQLEQPVLDPRLRVRGDLQPTGLRIASDQRVEPELMNRHVALVQPGNLPDVHVDAQDIVSGIGKTRPCH